MDLGQFETSLPVKDIERSLAFYQALGFQLVDGGVDIRTLSLLNGDCRLALYQGYLDPPAPQLIFWQGEVEAIGRDLVDMGLTLEKGPHKDDTGAALMLLDPDGHPIFLINMPVRYANDPGYQRKMPPYKPTRLEPDQWLGRFSLGLAVQDVERSLAFYLALGFEPVDGVIEGDATLQNQDCRICLHQRPLDPTGIQLTFQQADTEDLGRDLRSKGLALHQRSIEDTRGGDLALLDPDGHQLCFINSLGV